MRRYIVAIRLWRVLQLVVLALAPLITFAAIDADSCWNSDQACTIHANLHQISDATDAAGLSVDIDCQLKEDELPPATYLLRRLERAQSVVLDGCHTPLGATSYGLQFLPNCDSVARVTVERFHTDVLQPFGCVAAANNDSGMQLEVLVYRHNEMATVGIGAFAHLAKLRELYFLDNSLRHVEQQAFDGLRMVERIHLENEPLLALKYADLFERTSVAELRLLRLKRVTPQLFGHLPETLRDINVRHTVFDGDAIEVTNPQLLRNISVVDCALKSFVLFEAPQVSVLHINVSGNKLRDFRVDIVGSNSTLSAVETLDLSANRLELLPPQWLQGLSNLRQLLLRDNQLKTLSLPQMLLALPIATMIDLRNNKLVALQQAAAADIKYDHTRIQIDRNPWNCMWLLNFAHTYPEKFRIFQYEKFISQINVNGLTCVPDDTAVEEQSTRQQNGTATVVTRGEVRGHGTGNDSALPLNVSTYTLIYGDPWDYKRNQRASALIIVFMLPLGIAILFVLLYLWIYCQKVFHLSYYRSFPWTHRSATGRMCSAERFDVVRQLPPLATASTPTTLALANNNEDYETPLSGITSLCNCNNIATPYANEKCHKSHHITYEALPSEQPYKIYEEIIGDDDDYNMLETDLSTGANSIGTQPFYDHLTFAEPKDHRTVSNEIGL